MKKDRSKCALVMVALVFCTFSLTMVWLNVANGNLQAAGVLLFVNPDKSGSASVKDAIAKTPSTSKVAPGIDHIDDFINGKVIPVTESAGTQKAAQTPGAKRVAVFLMDYQDTATQPFYPATIQEMMFGNGKFARYYKENSYSRQSITGNVFGWFTIPVDVGTSSCQANLETNVGPLIANSQINLNNYTNIVIITLCNGYVANGSSNTSPQNYVINGATYNKTVTWVNISANKWDQLSDQMLESMNGSHMLTNLEHLLIHEFGHALGLTHAHGLSCAGTLPNATCTDVGLGNHFDVMAYETIGLHMSAWEKAKLGWFSGTELGTITQSGTYTIGSLESQPPATQTISAVKAYKIKPSVNSTKTPIWIEFRKATGFDAGIATPALGGVQGGGGEVPPENISENQAGIFIYKEGFEGTLLNQQNPKTARLMYLRGAPNASNANMYKVSLNPGQTYSEPRYGLSITTLPTTSATSRKFQVAMNPNFACTHLAPTVTTWMTPSTTVQQGTVTNWSVSLRIVNKDYLSCGTSDFTPTLGNVPNGVIALNFNSPEVIQMLSTMAPDDERIRSLNVIVDATVIPVGTYNIPITLTNNTSGLGTTLNFPITVQ